MTSSYIHQIKHKKERYKTYIMLILKSAYINSLLLLDTQKLKQNETAALDSLLGKSDTIPLHVKALDRVVEITILVPVRKRAGVQAFLSGLKLARIPKS